VKFQHLVYQNPDIRHHARTLQWHNMDEDEQYSPEGLCFPPSAILVALLVMVGPSLRSLAVAETNVLSMLVALPIVSSIMTELKHLDIPVPCYNVIVFNQIAKLTNIRTLTLQSVSSDNHECLTGAVGFDPILWSFDRLTHLRIAGWGFAWAFLEDCTLPNCFHISIDDIHMAIEDEMEHLRSFLQKKEWHQVRSLPSQR
jgi:hypothetical protein